MPLETACKKVGVTVERLHDWELGNEYPTMRQAEELAKAYRRPFAVFFLPQPPRDFMVLQDFRAKTAEPLGTGAVFIIREIQQKQAWLRELREQEGEPLPFVGRFKLGHDPARVAADILATLEVDPARYERPNKLLEWINKAEAKGICVSRTSFIHSHLKLDSEEFQGFVIADEYAPFVFINSDDWDAPQLFTLVHEIAHIWIAASGIMDVPNPGLHLKHKFDEVELYCNEVAANALMPNPLMLAVARTALASFAAAFQAARQLGISSFAFLVRAFKMGLISEEAYRRYKKQADAEFRAYEQREADKKAQQKLSGKSGGADYYTLQLNKNGRLFTQIVMDAYYGGDIAPTQASSLLNTQVNKFSAYDSLIAK